MPGNSAHEHKDALIPFFLLTFAITWGIGAFAIFMPVQFEAIFGEISDRHPLYYFAVAAPTFSATLLTFIQDGWTGLGALYSRLIRWRFGIRWYALVLLGIPCLGWLVSRVAGATPLKEFNTTSLFLLLLVYLLITGPLGEELGWRGFALPRLLQRFNPFVASLVLGLIWGVWHLPSFFLSGMVQSNGLSLPVFIFGSVCMSFLATWLFQHTNGSVLIVILLHYMMNFSLVILGAPFPAFTLVMLVIVMLVVWLDKSIGWFHKEQAWIHVSQLPSTPPASPLT
jgi:membrane protease YdiL (CAAX protease family)